MNQKQCENCGATIYLNGANNWRHAGTRKIFCFPGQPAYATPAGEPRKIGSAMFFNVPVEDSETEDGSGDDQWFIEIKHGAEEDDLGPFDTQGAALDGLNAWAKGRKLTLSKIGDIAISK